MTVDLKAISNVFKFLVPGTAPVALRTKESILDTQAI
jgi:hypothetical protein